MEQSVALVALVGRGCSRAVLAGDHCQLPCTVQSQEAMARGLGVSVYERLVRQGVEPYFLDTQYRSHPAIMAFPSQAFYQVPFPHIRSTSQ